MADNGGGNPMDDKGKRIEGEELLRDLLHEVESGNYDKTTRLQLIGAFETIAQFKELVASLPPEKIDKYIATQAEERSAIVLIQLNFHEHALSVLKWIATDEHLPTDYRKQAILIAGKILLENMDKITGNEYCENCRWVFGLGDSGSDGVRGAAKSISTLLFDTKRSEADYAKIMVQEKIIDSKQDGLLLLCDIARQEMHPMGTRLWALEMAGGILIQNADKMDAEICRKAVGRIKTACDAGNARETAVSKEARSLFVLLLQNQDILNKIDWQCIETAKKGPFKAAQAGTPLRTNGNGYKPLTVLLGK